jgi:ketosteroid isomerase-like protein
VTDSEIAEQAVRKIHEAWLAAEVAGNTAAVLALCTGDVRWMAPGMAPVQGQEAGRRLLSCTGGSVVRIEVSDVRCEVSDTLAIKTARFRTHVRKAGKPAPEVVTGTHLWVLRREDAHWRVALVTWQLEGATERRASA